MLFSASKGETSNNMLGDLSMIDSLSKEGQLFMGDDEIQELNRQSAPRNNRGASNKSFAE